MEVSDWSHINKIISMRSPMNLGTSDYLSTIQNGADIGIYGRYRDIENLGGDIQFDNSIRY
jgi:hypothetical protein